MVKMMACWQKASVLFLVLLSGIFSCSKNEDRESLRPQWPSPTRGYILISIDTLRADHLGCYGYSRKTSPFLDQLAEKSTLFEHAIVQYPSTLTSHLSIFTGLYPEQHGVYAPYGVLSPEIPTLPEIMQKNGFRTFGHSEAGYVAGHYGFRRGFEEWKDKEYRIDSDAEITFQRGISSLKKIRPNERFFLFLHTYTVHDPYEPPEPYRGYFWPGEPPPNVPPSWGENLGKFNVGAVSLTKQDVEYYMARYDESIRYVDHVIKDFFAELKQLKLNEDTTVVITSDHGEEFLEHGRLAHSQLYDECLRVPLLIFHPKQTSGQRITSLVQSIDLMPTFLDLIGIKPQVNLSGRSLFPLLSGSKKQRNSEAYASFKDHSELSKVIYKNENSKTFKYLIKSSLQEADGFWVTKPIQFDVRPPYVEFSAYSYVHKRKVSVEINDTYLSQLQMDPERWQSYRIEIPSDKAKYTMRLISDGCLSPVSAGQSSDVRCLSFKTRGLQLDQSKLFDLSADPKEHVDLSAERQNAANQLQKRLKTYRFDVVHNPLRITLTKEQEEQLVALGYIR